MPPTTDLPDPPNLTEIDFEYETWAEWAEASLPPYDADDDPFIGNVFVADMGSM